MCDEMTFTDTISPKAIFEMQNFFSSSPFTFYFFNEPLSSCRGRAADLVETRLRAASRQKMSIFLFPNFSCRRVFVVDTVVVVAVVYTVVVLGSVVSVVVSTNVVVGTFGLRDRCCLWF